MEKSVSELKAGNTVKLGGRWRTLTTVVHSNGYVRLFAHGYWMALMPESAVLTVKE